MISEGKLNEDIKWRYRCGMKAELLEGDKMAGAADDQSHGRQVRRGACEQKSISSNFGTREKEAMYLLQLLCIPQQ